MSKVAPAHPPTVSAPIPKPAPSKPAWPIVVAGANLVYAFLHLALFALSLLLRDRAMGVGPSGAQFYPNPAAGPVLPLVLWGAWGALLSMLLIIGSVLLLLRRQSGVVFTMWGACLYLLTVVVSIVVHSAPMSPWWWIIEIGWPVLLILLIGFPPTKRIMTACQRVA